LGLLPFYLQHYRDLIEPLLDISLHGIRVDEVARRSVLAELQEKVADVERRLEEAVGYALVAKTGISNQRLSKYLYEELKLPVQRKRDPKTKKLKPTTDEVAIRKLMETPTGKVKLATSGPLILLHRESKKKMELVAEGKTDPDGRMRCGIGFITDTGRLTSQETPKGGGRNLQNIDRGMRRGFVADE
jgi:DNA polymerase I-like protein with 3'-5' exonuclease and polymerase domains